LRTFVTDLAVTERLAQETPANAILVTESGIFTPADVARLEAAGARAMLVGESLMRAEDVEAATRAMCCSPAPST
jgi:indole-3-glycerol phosphate synthase